jgi:hypothetical protein
MQHRVNISIDDISPHPKSGAKTLDVCKRIVEAIPDVKITLFVPTAYHRTYKECAGPLRLSDRLHHRFNLRLIRLPRRNYEIGFHGHYHGLPKERNDNDEFRDLTPAEGTDRIQSSIHEYREAGLLERVCRSFRPPAWRARGDTLAAITRVFEDEKELQGKPSLLLAEETYSLALYRMGDLDLRTCTWRSCDPPARPLKQGPYGYTSIVYHACEWDKNFLDNGKAVALIDWLKAHDFEYVFSGDLLCTD